jgi:hypothetical protein
VAAPPTRASECSALFRHEPVAQCRSPARSPSATKVIASSGEHAAEFLDSTEGKYRELVTDINLGRDKLDRWEVARRARQVDPAFPVVYMSGDSAVDRGFQGRSQQRHAGQALRTGTWSPLLPSF